jgi:hypothetical protein
MATTNEDATLLASARLDDGRVLMARQLSDRGTIEIALWQAREEGGISLQSPALEIAAEASEVEALQRLCSAALATRWEAVRDGQQIADAIKLRDGSALAAMRSGDDVVLRRRPDPDDVIRLPRPALDLLCSKLLPGIAQKLAALGPALPS